jgi:hypothetical protein
MEFRILLLASLRDQVSVETCVISDYLSCKFSSLVETT